MCVVVVFRHQNVVGLYKERGLTIEKLIQWNRVKLLPLVVHTGQFPVWLQNKPNTRCF